MTTTSYPISTRAFCLACNDAVPAEIHKRDGSLYLDPLCPQCGPRSSLIEHDAALFEHWEQIRRPNKAPEQVQTAATGACPLECGLCANHRQKSCIALLEVTTACNLACPVCYADAGPGEFIELAKLEQMMDAAVASADGKPEVLQISGGEPTCHPQIMAILKAAMQRPFKYVMLNTNGLALADGSLDAAELAAVDQRITPRLAAIDSSVADNSRRVDDATQQWSAMQTVMISHLDSLETEFTLVERDIAIVRAGEAADTRGPTAAPGASSSPPQ